MIDVLEFLWDLSVVSLFRCFLQGLEHKIHVYIKTLIVSSPSQSENTIEQVFETQNCMTNSYGDLGMDKSDGLRMEKTVVVKRLSKLEKRPPMLVVPKVRLVAEFSNVGRKEGNKEFEVEGKGFFLASKKGKREFMEDGFGVMLDIMGDTKQAYFAVIDGHGGRDAAEYVAENLGKNIVKELELSKRGTGSHQLEALIRKSYSITDEEFLSKGVTGGACVAGVLLKDGELHVANTGDCRVVLSRNGAAFPLTNDHRLTREDERFRIENSGGYVDCRHGVWRVNGSLAVSRAIGDLHLKEWVISEPEYQKYPITSDSEFLIMASDGLWDKVNNQEAVDVIRSENSSVDSCRKLVDISFSRGNLDDTTVVVINLQKFVQN